MHAALALIANRLPRGQASRQIMTLGLGQMLGYAVLLAAMPALTRLYSPTDFGLFATFSAGLSLLSVLVAGRYDTAIPLANDEPEARQLFALATGTTFGVAALMGLAAWLSSDWLLPRLQATGLKPLIGWLSVGLVSCGMFEVLSFRLLGAREFRRLSAARIVLTISTACLQVGLAFALSGPAGLVIGQAAGYGLAAIILWKLSTGWGEETRPTWRETLATGVRFRRFPLLASWSALVTGTASQLPAILIAALYGPQAAGWYLFAQRCLTLPMAVLQNPVSRVYLSEASRLKRTRPEDLPELYRQTIVRTFKLTALPLLALAIIAPELFAYVFGPEWEPAGVLCRTLAPLLLAQLVWTCVQPTLDVVERQDLGCLFALLQATLIAAALAGGSSLGASIQNSAVMMSAAGTLACVVSLAVTGRLTRPAPVGVIPAA
jgi:O-antigen/teichoic acid export membrane protein